MSFADDDNDRVIRNVTSNSEMPRVDCRRNILQQAVSTAPIASLRTTKIHRVWSAKQNATTVEILGKTYDLPALGVSDSDIPGAQDGVFARENIKRGTLTTEYVGEVLQGREEAIKRRNAGDGKFCIRVIRYLGFLGTWVPGT